MTFRLSALAGLTAAGIVLALSATSGYAAEHPKAAKSTNAAPDIVASGKAMFEENCAPCHQVDTKGKPGTAPSLTNKELLRFASDRFFAETIRDGRPDTPMPSFADVLQPAQIKAVIAYLRSYAKEPSRGEQIDAERPAKGDVLLGQERFQQICSSCHGSTGEGYEAGGSGTAIGRIGFLGKASDGFIRATIREGRSNTPMHGFTGAAGLANLSYEEIDGVIAYLRSTQRN